MFEEANRSNFGSWMVELVNSSLENMTIIHQFQWRNRMNYSSFDLLKSLQQCMNLGQDIIVSGLCLMKRATANGLKIQSNATYKLAVVCIFIAHKFYSDFHYNIEDFSISSGVTIKDISKLETAMLDLLEYNIILSERDYYGVLLFKIK